MSKEDEIEELDTKVDAYWQGYIQKQNEAMEICKICKYKNKAEQLEANNYAANNIISDYIDTWKKLKNKLEEDIKDNNQTMTNVHNYRNLQKVTKILYAQEILEILEGKGAKVE